MAGGGNSILKFIRAFFDGNPYAEGHIKFWRHNSRKVVFEARTLTGFKIKYRLTLHYERVNNDEFIAARMLEEEQLDALAQEFNEKFTQWMVETKRYFYLDTLYGIGHVIRITENEGVEDEVNCAETVKTFAKHDFIKCGCRLRLILCDVWSDKAQVEENYDMIDGTTRQSMGNELGLRKYQEAWTVMLMGELRASRKAWKEQMVIGSNRTYKGKWVEIQTESQGNEVVLRWNYKQDSESDRFHLRGFRREGAFAIADDDAEQGALVIDSWGSNWKTERLEVAKTYFYTLKISFLHKKSRGTAYENESEQERLRFAIAIPPGEPTDILEQRLTAWIEKTEGPPPTPTDPKREKMNHAFEELTSFVEFDESITQWENDLIKHIESKGYSAKERKDKIERLKLAVESLRIDRL